MINWRTKLAVLAGSILVASGLALVFAAPGANAARVSIPGGSAATGSAPATISGDNGDVKIHNSSTSVTDPRNEPHVCVFYLDAFGFDAGQSVTWQIKSWPPTGNRTVVASGTLTLDSSGNGHTNDMTLANGHYKLFWNFAGEKGFAKQKVFWVSCPAPTPTPTPTPSETPTSTPTESPTVTSSPMVTSSVVGTSTAMPTSTPTTSPVSTSPGQSGLPITGWPLAAIAGAAAVLLGTGGTAIVLARRRRGLHSR